MAKRPTVYDVAQAAGVSIATVSFAFRQPEKVRPATRDAVLEAARRLRYVPSASARGLAGGRTGALGLYSFDLFLESAGDGGSRPVAEEPEAGGPPTGTGVASDTLGDDADAEDFRLFPLYVDEVQRGFELECARRGHALLIGRGTHEQGAGVLDIASRVDGLALFPGNRSPEILDQVSHRVPVVGFAMPHEAGTIHHIGVDNRSGARDLTEHLVRVHGLTDVHFVGSPVMPDYADRFAGMQDALRGLRLPAPAEVLDPTPLAAPDPFPVVRRLLAQDAVPRALVCASDQHALDLLALLAAHGVDVPGRVVVTGFDGVVAGRLTTPTLTTVRQPMEAMGRLAVEILLAAITDPEAEVVERILPVRPVYRSSCGCG